MPHIVLTKFPIKIYIYTHTTEGWVVLDTIKVFGCKKRWIDCFMIEQLTQTVCFIRVVQSIKMGIKNKMYTQ